MAQTKRDILVLQVGGGAWGWRTHPVKRITITQPQRDKAGQFIGQRRGKCKGKRMTRAKDLFVGTWNVLSLYRTEESGPAKKVLCTKLRVIWDRRRRRPKLKWCDELEEGVAGAGCRNLRTNVPSREKWRKFIEEVKWHTGKYYQWKKKK